MRPGTLFWKVEGLGNDFVLLDWRERLNWERGLPLLAEQAPAVCNRRTGVGADGILIVGPGAGESLATMVVINFDGSRPEMCGNGLRTVAHHLAWASKKPDFLVATDAGDLRCEVSDLTEVSCQARINMGPARRGEIRQPESGNGRWFHDVSMGNPHAITFVDAGEDPKALAHALGPALELDPAYPDRTNVEFAQKRPDGSLTLWVWERGCGITQACGTGACATAAAAVDAGLAAPGEPITVHLPGGALTIEVPADKKAGVHMTGPAKKVFSARWG